MKALAAFLRSGALYAMLLILQTILGGDCQNKSAITLQFRPDIAGPLKADN